MSPENAVDRGYQSIRHADLTAGGGFCRDDCEGFRRIDSGDVERLPEHREDDGFRPMPSVSTPTMWARTGVLRERPMGSERRHMIRQASSHGDDAPHRLVDAPA